MMRTRLLSWWHRRHSLRWRLPLSYAAIALLATVSLGILLLTLLRGYYRQQELDYLSANAQAIGAELTPALAAGDTDTLQRQISTFSFLAQARIEVLDAETAQVVADSGEFGTFFINMADPMDAAPPSPVTNGEEQFFNFDTENRSIIIVESKAGVEYDVAQETVEVQVAEDGATRTMTRTDSLTAQSTPFGFGLGETAVSPTERSDLAVEYPLLDEDGARLGVIRLSQGPAYGREIVRSVAWRWIAASVIAVLLAAGVGWWVSRRLTQPLLALTAVTAEMADGDLSTRAGVNRRDEVGLLGRSFNRMADRVEGTVTTLRRFVADAAHELNTPLTALSTDLDLLVDAAADAATQARAARARAQAARLQALVDSLLELSRLEAAVDEGERPLLDLVQLVQATGELVASQAEQANLAFAMQLPDRPLSVRGDEAQLQRALLNVLDNSVKFTPPPGEIILTLSEQGETAVITVRDTGIGIPPEDVPQLFNRFHRGRNTAGYTGSGLGLAITREIMARHNGQAAIHSGEKGTHVDLVLPSVRSSRDFRRRHP